MPPATFAMGMSHTTRTVNRTLHLPAVGMLHANLNNVDQTQRYALGHRLGKRPLVPTFTLDTCQGRSMPSITPHTFLSVNRHHLFLSSDESAFFSFTILTVSLVVNHSFYFPNILCLGRHPHKTLITLKVLL